MPGDWELPEDWELGSEARRRGWSSSVARLRMRGSRFWTMRGSGPSSLEKFAMASEEASSSSLGSYVEPESA